MKSDYFLTLTLKFIMIICQNLFFVTINDHLGLNEEAS